MGPLEKIHRLIKAFGDAAAGLENAKKRQVTAASALEAATTEARDAGLAAEEARRHALNLVSQIESLRTIPGKFGWG